MSDTLELTLPVYESKHGNYIRISDLPEGYERLELERWIFGKVQPLIQGKGKGVPAIQDAVFLEDYREFLKYRKGEYV